MSEIRPGDVDTVFAFGRTTFYQVRSWLVKATDMNVHPTRNRNFAIHEAWTFMSEIRTGDFDTVIAFGRTTVFPGAKLVGEGDGHECPSGMRIQRFCQSPVQFGLVFSS